MQHHADWRYQKDNLVFLENIAKVAERALTSTGLLKKRLDVGAKALISEFGKNLVDEGIKHAPELYKFWTSNIKNKGLKKALELDSASCAVQ